MLGMLTAILALASSVDFLSHQTMQHTLCFPRPSFSRYVERTVVVTQWGSYADFGRFLILKWNSDPCESETSHKNIMVIPLLLSPSP